MVATALQIGGAVALVAGLAMWSIPLAVVVGGVLATVVGLYLEGGN